MQITCTKCGMSHTPTAKNFARRKYHCRACRNSYDRSRSERLGVWSPKEFYGAGGPEERSRRSKIRYQTRVALERGEITRKPCEVCGAKAEVHHIDYETPFNLAWLCRRHHRQEHVRIAHERFKKAEITQPAQSYVCLPAKAAPYPFSKMDVGDSCLITGKLRHTVAARASKTAQRLGNGIRFSTHQVNGGVRVCRIA